MNLIDKLSSLSMFQIRAIAAILVLAVGYIDDITGVTLSFTLVYIVPIVFVSWLDGTRYAVGLSLLSAAFMFHSEFETFPLGIAFWNASSRLAILVGVIWTLNAIRDVQLSRLQLEVDKYTRVVETAIEGVVAVDRFGLIRHANGRAAIMLGYPSAELPGKMFMDLVGDEASRKAISLRMNLRNSETSQGEVQFVRKDGRSLRTLLSSSTFLDATKGFGGTVFLIMDISEWKHSEEELRRQYQEISAMQHLSTMLSRSIRLDEQLENALEAVLQVTGFDAGAIYMASEESNHLGIRHHTGFREGTAEIIQRWPIGKGITGGVCRTGVAQFLDDVEHNTVFDSRIRDLESISAFASIPLATKYTVLGVLNVICRKPHVFSHSEKSMLRTFGNQIGVALENAKLFEETRSSEQQIRRLSMDLVRIQEEERRRFARELHDGLAPLLMTLRMHAELAVSELGSADAEVEKRLREVIALAGEAESETKQISYDLRPAILDDFGLKAAFEVLAKNFTCRTGIRVDLHLPDSDLRFDSVVETTIYRIVQELLSNVVQHANASLVTIQLLIRAGLLALTVADNGKGFVANGTLTRVDDHVHSGLRNMRERTESLRGMFRVESAPGRGAEFLIELPCSLAAVEMEHQGGIGE